MVALGTGSFQVGYAKRSLVRGGIVGIATMLAYLLVVVITTPALPASAAINAALQINSVIIGGMGVGIGLQIFLSTYSKSLGCRLDVRRKAFGGNSGGTVLSSFFSFFSLVPLGCCGTWLYILSLLPSVIGSGLSAGLIAYSKPLSYLGLAIIFGFNAITIYKLTRENAKVRSMLNIWQKKLSSNRRIWIIVSAIAAAVTILVLAFTVMSVPSGSIIANEESRSSAPLVSPEKIVSGGPPKDGIPSIDSPKFVNAEKANFLEDGDLVIGLQVNGETKAYPLKILVWHEIVNDRIGNKPVAVTYCPLCFTSMVFIREIDDKEVEFGTSGKLYNSNLVMYDRLSDSLWSQAIGKGIAGKHSGYELKKLPFDLAYWREWKQLYPTTVVLSTDTGSNRPYGVDPYGDYYTTPQIYFPVEHKDDRLQPKEIVIGVNYDNSFKAYKLTNIEKQKVVNDSIGNKEILLLSLQPFMSRAYERTVDGKLLDFQLINDRLMDKQTFSEWNFNGEAISGQLKGKQLTRLVINPTFWFSWIAFHPDTKLYSPD